MGVVHRMIVCCAATVSMFAVVLCALVAVAAAQQPKPCQTPPQWQGKFERRADKFNATQYAEITYDETNKRVREIEKLIEGSNKTAYDILYLHNVNEEYRIDLKTKNCTKHPLSRPFIPFGMPDGAHYVGAANVGPVNIPDEHATVIIFDGVDEEEKARFSGTVTAPDCVPVTSMFVSNRTGFMHTMFFDITGGIPDPTVFIPPSNCVAVPPREHHPKFPH